MTMNQKADQIAYSKRKRSLLGVWFMDQHEHHLGTEKSTFSHSPEHPESETLVVGPSNPSFDKTSRVLMHAQVWEPLLSHKKYMP